MVEALICSSSWIRGAHDGSFTHVVCYSFLVSYSRFQIFLSIFNFSLYYQEEEDEDDVENISFPKSSVESN
jgi:hypothetical protein